MSQNKIQETELSTKTERKDNVTFKTKHYYITKKGGLSLNMWTKEDQVLILWYIYYLMTDFKF